MSKNLEEMRQKNERRSKFKNDIDLVNHLLDIPISKRKRIGVSQVDTSPAMKRGKKISVKSENNPQVHEAREM